MMIPISTINHLPPIHKAVAIVTERLKIVSDVTNQPSSDTEIKMLLESDSQAKLYWALLSQHSQRSKVESS